jgi:hypothetical protein
MWSHLVHVALPHNASGCCMRSHLLHIALPNNTGVVRTHTWYTLPCPSRSSMPFTLASCSSWK